MQTKGFALGKNYLVKHFPNHEFKARVVSIDGKTIWFKELGNKKKPFIARLPFIIDFQEIV